LPRLLFLLREIRPTKSSLAPFSPSVPPCPSFRPDNLLHPMRSLLHRRYQFAPSRFSFTAPPRPQRGVVAALFPQSPPSPSPPSLKRKNPPRFFQLPFPPRSSILSDRFRPSLRVFSAARPSHSLGKRCLPPFMVFSAMRFHSLSLLPHVQVELPTRIRAPPHIDSRRPLSFASICPSDAAFSAPLFFGLCFPPLPD